MDKKEDEQIKEQKAQDYGFVPFRDAEEAWFWFVQAQQAREDGARYSAGLAVTPRPCEPADILKILYGLYKSRLLHWDHMLVLRHYGRRQMPPDPHRVKEVQASKLWLQAMRRLEQAFYRKAIIEEPQRWPYSKPHPHWSTEATLYRGEVSSS